MTFCARCSHENSADTSFCSKCGAVLSASAPEVPIHSSALASSLSAAPREQLPAPLSSATSPTPASPSAIVSTADAGDAALAGTGDRAIAALLDLGIAVALFPLIGMWAARQWGGITGNGFELHGAAAFVTLFMVCSLWFFYSWLLEGLFGVTFGKLMMKLRVRRVDAGSVGLKKAFIRNLFRLIDGIGVYLVGFIAVLWSRRRQRLGDHAAGTLVVQGRTGKPARILATSVWAAIILACFIGAFALRAGAPASASTAAPSPSGSPGSGSASNQVPVSAGARLTRAEMGTDSTEDYQIIGAATRFYTDTPKIVCVWEVESNDLSVPMRSVWIAEDVGTVAPPNYQIAEKSLAGFPKGAFSLDSPTHGLPAGKYRLEIYIGEKLAKQIPFAVTQR